MESWMRWNLVYQRQEDGPSSGGGEGSNEGESSPEGQRQSQNNSESSPTGTEGTSGASQSPFSNPALAGRSEDEIAQLLSVQEATIREQGRRLNEDFRRQQPEPQPQPQPQQQELPAQAQETEVDPAEYWANPGKYMRQHREETIKAVKREMESLISPFIQDLSQRKVTDAWTTARSKHADFQTYEPLVRELLSRSGITNPTAETLDIMYFTAVGYASKTGGSGAPTASAPNGGGNNPPSQHRPAPPQHPASSQPIRQQEAGKKIRELTENERVLAKMNRMTPEEYIRYLEMDEADVSKLPPKPQQGASN